MKKLALALAAVAAIGLSVPALSTTPAAAAQGLKVAQADVSVRVGGDRERRRGVKKVIVKRDRGWHRGWEHRRGGTKKVIIKRRGGTTVKKVIRD
jgi:hypothetical protein